jgi:mono/diheme cytochrome c family protein
MVTKLPRALQKTLAVFLFIIAFLYMGSFETVREAGRRPFIIYDHMYSNSILKSQMPQVRQQGVLKTAKWSTHKEVDHENQLEAGAQLFRILCISCHSVDGYRNDILVRTEGMEATDIETVFLEMGKDKLYMPPFPGNNKEGVALARYIAEVLPKK